jgi:hypothetical protein
MTTAALNAHFHWTNDTNNPWEGLPQAVQDYLSAESIGHNATGFTEAGPSYYGSSNET